jgi:hypothetical protein
MFGREVLLSAQRSADERRRQENQEELDRQLARRKSLLGETVVQATIAKMDFDKNGITLKPGRSHDDEFRRQLALGEDFAVSNLELKAKGDQTSGWMNYKLNYVDNNSLSELLVFQAGTGTPYLYKADTRIVVPEEDSNASVPVEFESPGYRFIRTVSGLFLPEVLKTLEAEGL